RRWIVWFVRHYALPPAGLSNQFISRHSRSAIRARCSITHKLLSVIDRITQISLLGTSSISRIVKTSRTFCGSFARQSRITCQNSVRCVTSSAFQNPNKPASLRGTGPAFFVAPHPGEKCFLHQVLGHFGFVHMH